MDSLSFIAGQMLLRMAKRCFFTALIAYSCSGPRGNLFFARTTVPNHPWPKVLHQLFLVVRNCYRPTANCLLVPRLYISVWSSSSTFILTSWPFFSLLLALFMACSSFFSSLLLIFEVMSTVLFILTDTPTTQQCLLQQLNNAHNTGS
jgi:hypothetical protein